MNAGYVPFIAGSESERRDVFLTAANRLGTTIQNVEKDFWVCWTLDALFNGLPEGGPRLLFKGGTSLSKAFGLISRFSEDIDITVFRQDIGQSASIEELETLGGKKRRARLDAIKTMKEAGISQESVRIELDPEDEDRQSLLFWYPSVVDPGEYVHSAIKIESGAKSALEPNQLCIVTPYIVADLPNFDLRVDRVTTVNPERTLWDKIVILHGQRRWFEKRGEFKKGGQRVSRHYYDVFNVAQSEVGKIALGDIAVGKDCARHAQMFFFSADFDLKNAVPGTLAICPTNGMKPALQRDYRAMSGMIFGGVPSLEDIVDFLSELEKQLNG